MNRKLTKGEAAVLAQLNQNVTDAIRTRREWLDSKMEDVAGVKSGDVLHNRDTGARLGTVSRLYRFWMDRDGGVRDTSLDVSVEYETSPRCFDNTSRQPSLRWGLSPEPRPARKLCVPRVPHNCRLCNEVIAKGEPCEKWPTLIDGEGWRTSYAHPECLAAVKGWDDGDWECNAPGDLKRPATNPPNDDPIRT